MSSDLLPAEAQRAIREIRRTDIVIGIPSYNNVRTIGHVVRAAHAGLTKYFPHFSGVIVNSDGGSKDGTREAALSTELGDTRLLMLSTPLLPVHRLSFPYHGIPGKGSAFRMIFQIAEQLGAKTCAVVDSDLRSITPEWIDLLLRPVLYSQYDLVAPYYHRHKYDGTITNSIIYPLTRALYGIGVRQPIGGDFGLSERLLSRLLRRGDWETDVARYGIDIWITTVALAESFRVCQSFLGAKLHDAKDPSSDLSAMLEQVVGSVFSLMQEYAPVWKQRHGSVPADLFGFRFDVGLDPIAVNLERMLTAFRRGCRELSEIWALALDPATLDEILMLGKTLDAGGAEFHLDNNLWTRMIYDFARGHKNLGAGRGHLLRSLTPLYLARVASFVIETRDLGSADVERKIEELCLSFEALKPDLIRRWNGNAALPAAAQTKTRPAAPQAQAMEFKS